MARFEGYTWINSSRAIIFKTFTIYILSKVVYEHLKQCEYVK